jgi:restriction endonuclease S subunit
MNGIYPFFTSGDAILRSDKYLVDGENLFISTGGFFNIKFYNGLANYSADTYSIKGKNCNTKFLYYYILNIGNSINEKFFQGSGLAHLQKDELKKLILLIPQNIHEQQAIAQVLSDMDKEIDALQKRKNKLMHIKQAAMHLLLTGKVRLIHPSQNSTKTKHVSQNTTHA